MKYYTQLKELRIFTYNDAVKFMKSRDNATLVLRNMIKKGIIKRVKKDLYVVKEFFENNNKAKYIIGSYINDFSFISYHSALEYYELETSSLRKLQVSSPYRFYDLAFEGYDYCYCRSKILCQVDIIDDIKVTSIERTIIDCINTIGKEISLNELTNCLEKIDCLNEEKLKEVLLAYNKDTLYKKAGYYLAFFKDQLNLSNEFFDFCKMNTNDKNKTFFVSRKDEDLVYISEWSLYAYKNIR